MLHANVSSSLICWNEGSYTLDVDLYVVCFYDDSNAITFDTFHVYERTVLNVLCLHVMSGES